MRDELRQRWRRLILIIAFAFLGATWFSFVWASMTGRTFLAKYQVGTPNPIADPARELRIALVTTTIAGPVALLALMARRRT